MKKNVEQPRLVSDEWFEDHDVFWIQKDKQREVILNPGSDYVWFKKVYPLKGEFTLTRKRYISDLPQNCFGHIIAVSATSQDGRLKTKPVGTFFELFESPRGYRTWTCPKEYSGKNTRKDKYKLREVQQEVRGNKSEIGTIEGSQ